MAQLSSPISNEFRIGVSELRLGPLSEAGRLAQARSVGVIDDVVINFASTSVDLKAQFPQVIAATAVTEQTGAITGGLREYSRRNINLMLGNPIVADPVESRTTLVKTADIAANATSFSVASATAFAADDVVMIYPDGQPENVTVSQIASIAAAVVTLKTGMGTVVAYPALADNTRDYIMVKAHAVAAGAVTKTNYFSAMILGTKPSNGAPVVWSVWKVANTGSFEQSNNATDWASMPMELKIVSPTASDTKVGGGLATMAPLINLFPMGALFAGADS
jgi:hypothetical protein